MTLAGIARSGLQVISVATAAMAIWLLSVVLFVLPARDPGHSQLWAIVAVGSAGLVALSAAATRRTAAPVAGLLAIFSMVAVAFGLLVVGSSITPSLSDDSEGYLIVIGLILTIHGALGLAWGAVTLRRSRA